MDFLEEQKELNYMQIWQDKFWKPLMNSEHFAMRGKDIRTICDFGYKVYKMGGYYATTKFFAEQLEILNKGAEKCQNKTKQKSANGFLSLLARLLLCCASLRKLWILFRR